MASRSASQRAGGPGRGGLAGLGAGDGSLPTAAGTDSERDAADDRWIFWSSQLALFSLMTAGVTALVLTLGDGLFPPGTGGLVLIVLRMTGFAMLFGILAWIYRRPWFQRLRGWAFGAGVVGACAAMTLLDMAVFPLVIHGIMSDAAVILERYPVPVTVNRFAFCVLWSTLFFVLRQRADVRRTRWQATSALLALRTSELERLSQQIEPHFLFNALSAVLACRHDPDGVEAVTTALGDYLRFSLARGAEPEPLGQELDAVEQLLSIHEARFLESLSCSVAASLAARPRSPRPCTSNWSTPPHAWRSRMAEGLSLPENLPPLRVLPRHKAATWVGRGRGRKSTRPGANGVVELTPFEFLDRLVDLVPPPRKHRHRYHGVFAPNHKLRKAVTARAIGNIGKRCDAGAGGHVAGGQANRSNRHRSRPPAARPPTGVSSCRSTTTETSFRDG